MSEELRRIGYIHISPQDRKTDLQIPAILTVGCEPADIHSTNELLATPVARKRLLDLLHNGDKLIVYQQDRLCRDEHSRVNLRQLLAAMNAILCISSDDTTGLGGDCE